MYKRLVCSQPWPGLPQIGSGSEVVTSVQPNNKVLVSNSFITKKSRKKIPF